MRPPVPIDPWAGLREATPARIGLDRRGDVPALRHVLAFQHAHALARDAVHAAVDTDRLLTSLAPEPVISVSSQATVRDTYLRRPDLGRRLAPEWRAALTPGDYDVVFVIADGLSAKAINQHALPTLDACRARLTGWRLAPVVLARGARVALGDDIGECLGARFCIMLIGERPGLTVSDSLSIYLTMDPKIGRSDAERNCISNIHGQGGLTYEEAGAKAAWIVNAARRIGSTGVNLKDDGNTVKQLTSP